MFCFLLYFFILFFIKTNRKSNQLTEQHTKFLELVNVQEQSLNDEILLLEKTISNLEIEKKKTTLTILSQKETIDALSNINNSINNELKYVL